MSKTNTPANAALLAQTIANLEAAGLSASDLWAFANAQAVEQQWQEQQHTTNPEDLLGEDEDGNPEPETPWGCFESYADTAREDSWDAIRDLFCDAAGWYELLHGPYPTNDD